MEMRKVYEEMLSYFENASDADLKEDLLFLESQEKTDVLVSDYVDQLKRKIETTCFKKSIECHIDCDKYSVSEEFYLAA
ncbi:MAG: hypothetical protein MJZ23_01000 [Paludibacteraceae bacterium]|nr:hypothetical protein [Paludibacteraceae bacterium]